MKTARVLYLPMIAEGGPWRISSQEMRIGGSCTGVLETKSATVLSLLLVAVSGLMNWVRAGFDGIWGELVLFFTAVLMACL